MNEKSRIIIFALLLLTMSLFNVLSSGKSFSDRENRFLAQIPKFKFKNLMNGEFTADFDEYASDQFMMRDTWIGMKTRLDLSLLKKDNTRVYFGKNHYLFDVEKPIKHDKFIRNMTSINKLNQENNKPLDILLIPTKSTIYKDYLPYKAPVLDEEKLLLEMKENMADDINLLTMIETFNAHKNEALYYKTDHHYTSLGAYYTYKNYVESIGMESYDFKDFNIEKVSEDFLGTLFRKANFYSGERETIERFVFNGENQVEIKLNDTDIRIEMYDDSFLDKADKYSYFLGGDHPLLEIKTISENKETLVIVKDSFANSMIPFLTLHFEKIIVIDQRYYNLPIINYLEGIDYDRILYLFNLRTFYDQ